MLSFRVFEDGEPAKAWSLNNAHLLGADNIAVRAVISFENGLIYCEKRSLGPVALALQHTVSEIGELILQTTLLPEREEPYLLTLELARHRLMMFFSKQEDWAMFDLESDHPANRRMLRARQHFIKALSLESGDPCAADRVAREALRGAIDASEELALAHAELFINHRKMSGHLTGGAFGCGVELKQTNPEVRASLQANFDYLSLPTRWRMIEPNEQQYDWNLLDGWVEWAFRNQLPVLAGPIISFEQAVMPDWMAIVEHDYETLRDLFYEHTERLVERYQKVVTMWNVVSGIHVNNQFTLSLEQLMDLTRMAVMLTKKIQPAANTLVEITQPFGEYYSDNIRSIPPMIYADMIIQSGVPVDCFGIKLLMGQPNEGRFTRDLMQLSALLDKFNGLGKPVHITCLGVPSEPLPVGEEGNEPLSGGWWRRPWSQLVQSHWLEAIYNIALSKPFIESVAWAELADHEFGELPNCGLAMNNLKTKNAFHRFVALRKSMYGPPADTITTSISEVT